MLDNVVIFLGSLVLILILLYVVVFLSLKIKRMVQLSDSKMLIVGLKKTRTIEAVNYLIHILEKRKEQLAKKKPFFTPPPQNPNKL